MAHQHSPHSLIAKRLKVCAFSDKMDLRRGGDALKASDSTTECWGYSRYGQLGIGARARLNQPVLVNGINFASSGSLWHETFGQNCAGGDAVAQRWLNLCSAVGPRQVNRPLA